MFWRVRCLAALALLCGAGLGAEPAAGAEDAGRKKLDETLISQLYQNVEPVDVEKSRELLSKLQIAHFEFEYDSIKGRRQVGLLPEDVQDVIPEAIDVAATRTFPPQEPGGKMIKLEQFPSVNKDVVFMHNVAAIQAIATSLKIATADLSQLLEHREQMDVLYEELHRRLALEADAQAVERRKLAEAEAEKARLQVAKAKAAEDEGARILAARESAEEKRLQREDELARERAVLADLSERNRTLEALAMQRETAEAAAQQALERAKELSERRTLLERKLEEKKREADVSRAEAEARAKALLLRETKDIRERKAAAEAEAERKRLLETVSTIMDRLGNAVFYVLEEPSRVFAFVMSIVGLVAVTMVSREASAMVRRLIEASIGRPQLLRETSVSGGWLSRLLRILGLYVVVDLFGSLLAFFRGGSVTERESVEAHFADVVLPELTKERVILAARISKGARHMKAPLRNVLLYGPPGTGKTMVARRLAEASGLDYAIMSGGDVAAVGSDSVRQLHALFNWANRSPKGLLLFIDEAEAFLASRARAMSEETRAALNALLYHTGTASSRFCLVLATNRAEDLDSAVLDRMDDSMNIALPEAPQRQAILTQYMLQSFKPWEDAPEGKAGSSGLFVRGIRRLPVGEGLTQDEVDKAALKMKRFSGREISKTVSSLYSAALCASGSKLTLELFWQLLHDKLDEHAEKERMLGAATGVDRDGLFGVLNDVSSGELTADDSPPELDMRSKKGGARKKQAKKKG